MGNVNGSVSGAEEEIDGDNNSVHEGMAAPDRSQVGYHPPDSSYELMGQSPPHIPRATQCPLMFTPQVPILPIMRHDEMHMPGYSLMQNTLRYDDKCNEQGIPTMITWSYGGKEVAVEGSWDGWKSRILLQKSGKDLTIIKVLGSGVYHYRFVVDGQWRYAPEFPWAQDDAGNAYNILDLQDYVPEDIESVSGFEPPQSPDLSYNNLILGSDEYMKEPPLVPPHLQTTLLNVPSSSMDIPPPLSRPQHVVLNHLYMQKEKSNSGPSFVALGSTQRFRAKYVTVVLYKSLPR